VDTVYRNDYGWNVGPDYAHTRPTEGMTVLNYVCYWSDVIEASAPRIGQLLLQGGADLERDDAQELWFTPIHNAVANGASELVDIMLEHRPQAINLTTGDGRRPLHVLALCENEEHRMQTLEVLLRGRRDPDSGERVTADLSMAEPFYGNSPLHAHAKKGFIDVAVRLLEAGAPAHAKNDAGRTPLEELTFDLDKLERENEQESVLERSRMAETKQAMELSLIADGM